MPNWRCCGALFGPGRDATERFKVLKPLQWLRQELLQLRAKRLLLPSPPRRLGRARAPLERSGQTHLHCMRCLR